MSGLSGSLTPALTRTLAATANAGPGGGVGLAAGGGVRGRSCCSCCFFFLFFLDTAHTPWELLSLLIMRGRAAAGNVPLDKRSPIPSSLRLPKSEGPLDAACGLAARAKPQTVG